MIPLVTSKERNLSHLWDSSDLDYIHDSTAEVDLNVVMTDDGRFVEIQGCAEHKPFTEESMASMLKLAKAGLKQIHCYPITKG